MSGIKKIVEGKLRYSRKQRQIFINAKNNSAIEQWDIRIHLFEDILQDYEESECCPNKEQGNEHLQNVTATLPDFAFSEWAAMNYTRLNKVWCHKYVDQRDESNWLTTEQLYRMYIEGN